jgi:hypothetical protein
LIATARLFGMGDFIATVFGIDAITFRGQHNPPRPDALLLFLAGLARVAPNDACAFHEERIEDQDPKHLEAIADRIYYESRREITNFRRFWRICRAKCLTPGDSVITLSSALPAKNDSKRRAWTLVRSRSGSAWEWKDFGESPAR